MQSAQRCSHFLVGSESLVVKDVADYCDLAYFIGHCTGSFHCCNTRILNHSLHFAYTNMPTLKDSFGSLFNELLLPSSKTKSAYRHLFKKKKNFYIKNSFQTENTPQYYFRSYRAWLN